MFNRIRVVTMLMMVLGVFALLQLVPFCRKRPI